MKSVLFATILLLLFYGCAKEPIKEITAPGKIQIENIEILCPKQEVKVGEKVVLRAIGRDKNYKNYPIHAKWECVEGSVLFTPSEGTQVEVTPMDTGMCYIKAQFGNGEGIVGLKVIP